MKIEVTANVARALRNDFGHCPCGMTNLCPNCIELKKILDKLKEMKDENTKPL